MSLRLKDAFSKPYKRFLGSYKKILGGLSPKYTINQKRIEIEITTYCNLKCFNCNRSCRQAPSDEYMTVEQLKHFINETIKYNKSWKEIHLIGGEPTFHKDLFEICNLLLDFKAMHSPKTNIFVATNGFGKEVNEVLLNLPTGIEVINTSKESAVNDFDTYNVAPIDVPEFRDKKIDFSAGCWVMESCGMALTRYGYYCCGPGASVDRVFNFGIGIQDLNQVNEKSLRQQTQILCQYCGIFKRRYKPDGARDENHGYVRKEQISPTWEKAYKKYNASKPVLSLY